MKAIATSDFYLAGKPVKAGQGVEVSEETFEKASKAGCLTAYSKDKEKELQETEVQNTEVETAPVDKEVKQPKTRGRRRTRK